MKNNHNPVPMMVLGTHSKIVNFKENNVKLQNRPF